MIDRQHLPAIVAIVVVAIAARLYLLLSTGYLVDDAMITFRYADNLAIGAGFVYNAGERVLGTTTPLWTCYLALIRLCGAPVPLAAHATSIILAGLTAVVVYKFARSLGAGSLAVAAGVAYALYPRSVVVDICGLETALFSCLMLTVVYCLSTEKYSQALVLAALAAVTRPEGILMLFVAGIVSWWKLRRLPIPGLVIAGFLVSVWMSFSVFYFGSPIPNSLLAKEALYSNASASLLRRLAEMLLLTQPLGWLLLVAGFTGMIYSQAQRFWLFLILCSILTFALPIAIFSPRIFFWYPAPLIPLGLVAIAAGGSILLNRLSTTRGRQFEFSAAVAACLAVVGVAGVVLYSRVESLSREMDWYRTTHIAAAEYLNAHAAPTDVVVAEDIGHFGYRYRGPIIDRDGLVSPEVIEYNRSGRYLQFVDSIAPDWILLSTGFPASATLLNDEHFNERYQQVDYSPGLTPRTHDLFHRRILNIPD